MQTRNDKYMKASPRDALCGAIRGEGVRTVARAAKLSPTSVSRWIRGQIWLSAAAVDRIAKAVEKLNIEQRKERR